MSDAKLDQAKHGGDYAGDDWHKIDLEPGTKLYQLDRIEINEDGEEEIVGSKYFIDEKQMEEGGYLHYETVLDEYGDPVYDEDGNEVQIAHFDAEKYADDMQIRPYITEDGQAVYSDHVSEFVVPEGVTVHAEESVTDSNYGYGHGGGRQLFIDEHEQEKLMMVDNEEIEVDQPDMWVGAAEQMQKHGREIAEMSNDSMDEDDEAEFKAAAAETLAEEDDDSSETDENDEVDLLDRMGR